MEEAGGRGWKACHGDRQAGADHEGESLTKEKLDRTASRQLNLCRHRFRQIHSTYLPSYSFVIVRKNELVVREGRSPRMRA